MGQQWALSVMNYDEFLVPTAGAVTLHIGNHPNDSDTSTDRYIDFHKELEKNFIIKKGFKTIYQIDNNIENKSVDFSTLYEEIKEDFTNKPLFNSFKININRKTRFIFLIINLNVFLKCFISILPTAIFSPFSIVQYSSFICFLD